MKDTAQILGVVESVRDTSFKGKEGTVVPGMELTLENGDDPKYPFTLKAYYEAATAALALKPGQQVVLGFYLKVVPVYVRRDGKPEALKRADGTSVLKSQPFLRSINKIIK